MRGYPIKGTEIKLPENIKGFIVREEDEKLQIDNNDRVLKLSGKFDKFMYWNYDKNPSENDGYRKAMHWLKVSDDVRYKENFSLMNLQIFYFSSTLKLNLWMMMERRNNLIKFKFL